VLLGHFDCCSKCIRTEGRKGGQYEQIRCSLRTFYHGVSIYDLKNDNRFDSATLLQEADIFAIFSFRFLDGFLFPMSKID